MLFLIFNLGSLIIIYFFNFFLFLIVFGILIERVASFLNIMIDSCYFHGNYAAQGGAIAAVSDEFSPTSPRKQKIFLSMF